MATRHESHYSYCCLMILWLGHVVCRAATEGERKQEQEGEAECMAGVGGVEGSLCRVVIDGSTVLRYCNTPPYISTSEAHEWLGV